MTKIRSALLAAALVAAWALMPATAGAAVDPACLTDPRIGPSIYDADELPALTTKNEQVDVAVLGAVLADCPNTSVTAVTPGGGVWTVPLNKNLPAVPPYLPARLGGAMTIPLGYGAGTWHLTKITSNGTSKTLHHPFLVRRGGTVVLNTPASTAAPAPVIVSGTLKHYTPTGTLVPSPNTTVAIIEVEGGSPVLARLKTNASGTFSGGIPMMRGETAIVAQPVGDSYGYGVLPIKKATVTQAVPPKFTFGSIQAPATGYVNQWLRFDAKTTPGDQWSDLLKPHGSGWVTTGSFGYTTPAGQLTRWWKPAAPGTYTLRLWAGALNFDYEELTIAVTSKQTIPTYLDGTVGSTSGGTVYRGTQMTAQGHLKVRYSNGTIGPFANQRVRLAARPAGNVNWSTDLGTVTTNANGYFLRHFAMPYKTNTDIRFLYFSPHVTIKTSGIVKSNIKVTP